MKVTHFILIPVGRGRTPCGSPKIKLPNSMIGIGQKNPGAQCARFFSFPNHELPHEGRLGSFHPDPKRSRKHFVSRASSTRFSTRVVLATMDFLFRRPRGSENSSSILPRFCSHHKL